MNSEKYYLVFSDATPNGVVMTFKQMKQVKGYKYFVEIDDVETIPLINEVLEQV
jgi:hypothetical protein